MHIVFFDRKQMEDGKENLEVSLNKYGMIKIFYFRVGLMIDPKIVISKP